MYFDQKDFDRVLARHREAIHYLIAHVKQLYVKNTRPGHGFDHVLRGLERAKTVCQGTKTSVEIAIIAYLCHDFHRAINVDHEWVARFIHNNVPDDICNTDEKNSIIQAINNHSTLDREDESELEIIVKDIDRVDVFGAIGAMRICQHRYALPPYAPRAPFEMGSTREMDLHTLVDDFYRVLEWELWLRMPGAIKLARPMIKFTKNFLRQMEKELIALDLITEKRVDEIFAQIEEMHKDHPRLPEKKKKKPARKRSFEGNNGVIEFAEIRAQAMG